jgi:hypothetical protein
VRYNSVIESPSVLVSEDDIDDNASVSCNSCNSAISIIEKNNAETKKSVQFNDVVITHSPTQPPITQMEKQKTWYSREELRKMREHYQLYIKFVSSIGPETTKYLLNNEAGDNGEIVCWRGLERYIPSSISNESPSSISQSLSVRRKQIVKQVLFEQSRLKAEPAEQPIEEIIRTTSIECSKICSEYAYCIAQKSYCFSIIAA